MEPITQITENIISDLKKEKISLIEDIFKVRRLLFGFGFENQDDVIFNPALVFDELYEQSITDLELILATDSASASLQARKLGGFYE